MVFNVQEAKNLAMKIELLFQEQTHSTNCRKYGSIDNKALSDKGKSTLFVYNIVETANIGVGKKEGSNSGRRCGEVGHHSNECPKRRAVNIVEKDDDFIGDEVCEPEEDGDYKQEEYNCAKNQPKALKTEGRNFLPIVHGPSSFMGECKETQEVHLMVGYH
ncbi:conserved hypothetical protein [Ricinus communis]|uniref:CCHC-type domain-containing protein n=1 Tax=Ricinus communis TaxID=3988 RepID=B9S5L1_RICCO|nr:conserved hypothetical protein [Ricinus communis]